MLKLRISQKLPLTIIGIAVLSSIIISAILVSRASTELFYSAEQKLIALKVSRKEALKHYLDSIDQDLSSLSQNEYVREALLRFDVAWDELGGNQERQLQGLYIENNPHPTGEKENLDYATDGSAYSAAHKKYHPWFRHFLRQRDYYDIFLFDTDGNLIYTVFKELDYATNLNTGKYKDSDLGNAFRAARDNPERDNQSFFDFKPYAPSHGAAASFISQPILHDDGSLAGVLVFQMPIARINAVMQVKAGLGESGETYLVGSDFLMRSDSRFSEESTILKTKVEGETVKLALAGEEGVQVVLDYRGIPVLSAYGLLDYHGTKWAVLAEIDEAEVLQPVTGMKRFALLAVLALIVVVAAISVFLARRVAKPISNMTGAMKRIAEGDVNVSVPGLERSDEIGAMAQATQVFKENAIEKTMLEKEQQEAKKRAEEERKKVLRDLADDFEKKVGSVIQTITSAASGMSRTAESMQGVVTVANEKSSNVASASEETNQNVQAVASASEEMSASVNEISQQLSNTTKVVHDSVQKVESTDETAQQLSSAAGRIGTVVEMIQGIAEQINLLALNATIESARAGEAGKGFAVVASEVKNLANQASKAVEEIGQEIDNMQTVSESVIGVLHDIKEGVNEISSYTNNVSAAVEEQSAATKEIASNMSTASAGVSSIVSDITGVTDATQQADTAAAEVLKASQELSKQSEVLSKEVDVFLAEISDGERERGVRAVDEEKGEALEEAG